jgi:Abnormal spindle-like microcephaly-assoc'd, ASPM-SPD-2-Hydin
MLTTPLARLLTCVVVSLALLLAAGEAAQATTAPLTLSAKNRIDFGRVPAGETVYRTVTLTNNGPETAFIGTIGVSAETGAFTLVVESVTCGATLAPQASCSWTIAFTPPWPGKHLGVADAGAQTVAADGSVTYTLTAMVKLLGRGI